MEQPIPKYLTENQIGVITTALHEHIQFFDEQGKPENEKVIEKIEKILEAVDLNAFEGTEN